MLKIGLTGGIGSGKTRVADLFHEWGASVIDTDVIAHELTAPAGEAMAPIHDAFGDTVLTPEGALDRVAMRELVFRDPAARSRLEGIIHPLIARQALAAAETASGCYLVFVVPLLVESKKWISRVDRVCVVDCDPDTQVARVQARSRLTADEVRRIMSVQASREARLAVAHDVVLNDGSTTPAQLQQRARQLHEQWCAFAQAQVKQ